MLIAELPAGPLDIVGDVHGEIEPLRALLGALGYQPDGRHPECRRLVFVGDLTDRGPDSPAVVELVAALVGAGRAHCVLGNHELNILRDDRKEGNRWFWGERETYPSGAPTGERLADDRIRDQVTAFFRTLPLALVRDDLRVVHACWREQYLEALDGQRDVLAFGEAEARRIEAALAGDGQVADAERERRAWNFHARDPRPPMLPAAAAVAVARQNDHPVRVITSGLEDVADQPFWAGGKWRLERRVPWWESYQGPFVVVGHYWRTRRPGEGAGNRLTPDLFAGADPERPLGPGHVMCVDYSIGKRAWQRAAGHPADAALAAYRWPERQLVFAD